MQSPPIRTLGFILCLILACSINSSCNRQQRPHPRAQMHNNQGVVYLKRNLYDKALREFKIAIELSPRFADAHQNLGLYYELTGDLDRSVQSYKTSIKCDHKYAEPENGLCSVYLRRKDYKKAVKHGKKALKKDPFLADAAYNLGLVYSALKDGEKTAEYFRRATDINPNHLLAHNALGLFYLKEGRYDDAINRFKVSTEINPSLDEGWRYLGFTYYEKGELKAAENALKAALGANEKNADNHKILGAIYKKQGLAEPTNKLRYCVNAAVEFNYVVKNIDPHDGEAWGNHGIALRCIANVKKEEGSIGEGNDILVKAKLSLQKAIKEEPDFCHSYFWLGLLYLEDFKEKEKGISSLKEALHCSEKDPKPLAEVLFKLGTFYFEDGNTLEAKKYLCQFQRVAEANLINLIDQAKVVTDPLGGC